MTKSKKKQEQAAESAPIDEQQVEQPVAPDNASATEQPAAHDDAATAPHDDFEAKYNDLNDKHLRLMAEFDNYRKRMMRERADLIKNASERVVVELLPIIDDFERSLKAMETAADVAAVTDGVNLIYQKILTLLKQQGVTVIETENQPFNEERHEAVTTIPAPTEELKGKIVDCVQKGYQMNDKVIRFPKVVVGQ